MNVRQHLRYGTIVVLVLALALQALEARSQQFDFDTGNAPFEVIIPKVTAVITDTVSPMGNDATLILYFFTVITNSWFDAIAPYHPTAVGVYSRFAQRRTELTNREKNIAIFYASYSTLNYLLPKQKQAWDDMLWSVGLDPGDESENPSTPVGIGNIAGKGVVAARQHDGMNALGDEGGCKYNCQAYADYTGYKPRNTAYELLFPSRWQPNIVSDRTGIFRVQQFVTPQLRLTQPYSYDDPHLFLAPFPITSQVWNLRAYKGQADEVLDVSANLTDKQKMKAELFDNKLKSLGLSTIFAAKFSGLTLEEVVHYDFLTNMAAFDTAIAIWNNKYLYDAVRPFSAIRFLYGESQVTAWGGPGKGTVTDLPASQWRSYVNVADHPEYPSASASFCAAHAQVSRRFLGSDDLGWLVPAPKGFSNVEPGVTPARNIVLVFPTWTDFEEDCGLSRLWGGVHFYPSIPAGQDIGHTIGDIAFEFVRNHIDGNID